MDNRKLFQDIHGILSILAADPKWPSPANLYLIPDENDPRNQYAVSLRQRLIRLMERRKNKR